MLTTAYYGPRSSPIENAEIGEFVSEGIWGKPSQIAHFCSMAVHDDGKLVAATLYHNWEPESGVIQLSSYSATRRWLTKPVIRAMFDLPFNLLDCQLVVLRVSENNTPMIRIARSFGFSETLIPRLRGRDEGEFIFTYSDDQWRTSRYNSAAPDHGAQEVDHR